MRMRWAGIWVAMVLIALVAASGASGATEVGNGCAATNGLPIEATVMQIAEAPGNPNPLAVPSAGVITRWQVDNEIGEGVDAKLKVFRQGSPGPRVIGESDLETLSPGMNILDTRIQVQAGDRIGVFGSPGILACTGNSSDIFQGYNGDVPVGSEGASLGTGSGYKIALAAFVEPDVDHDGYGDETQDKCSRDATTHDECPAGSAPVTASPLKLDAFPVVLKRSVLLLVSVNADSSVKVSGQVSWKAAKHGAHSSKAVRKPKARGTVVKLDGGTQKVEGGSIGRFNVRFPDSLKKELVQLPAGKSVKGTLTATTTDAAGKQVAKTVAIRLHGKKKTHKPRK